MEVLKRVLKNRLFIAGLLVPVLFQIVYFAFVLPAIKDGNDSIKELKIAVVNEDMMLGNQITPVLLEVMPFHTKEFSSLSASLDSMNRGSVNMVIHIAPDFTSGIQQGGSKISYYINQSAPPLTKQIMDKTALSINQVINENLFSLVKETLKQSSLQAFNQAELPPAVLMQIGGKLNKVLDSLKPNIVAGDIKKVNNAEGFAQITLPVYVFLTYFVGCITMTILHTFVFRSFRREFSRFELFLAQLVVNTGFSLLIPAIFVGTAVYFDIPLSLGIVPAWFMLSLGFFTLLYMIQMFANWFGIPGMGLAALCLFPLQIVTSGLIYPSEILPAFYVAAGDYLPSTYFGTGILRMFFGGPSISMEVGILLLMAAVFLIVSALTLFKKERSIPASSG